MESDINIDEKRMFTLFNKKLTYLNYPEWFLLYAAGI